MRRDELVEQIIMIAVLVGFLYHVFTGYDPPWFHALLYYVSPIALAVILVRRYRRMQEGFEFSRKIVDAQHTASGRNVLGEDPRTGGAPRSPYPGVMLPDQSQTDVPDLPGISGRRPDEDEK